jgi:transposase-like protein
LRKAIKTQGVPKKIAFDAYAASHRVVAKLKEEGELPQQVIVRSSKYLNNVIEQDHPSPKIDPMMSQRLRE